MAKIQDSYMNSILNSQYDLKMSKTFRMYMMYCDIVNIKFLKITHTKWQFSDSVIFNSNNKYMY